MAQSQLVILDDSFNSYATANESPYLLIPPKKGLFVAFSFRNPIRELIRLSALQKR